MNGLLSFLRELFAAPRDAAPPAAPKTHVVRTPGTTPVAARVTAPPGKGIVFRNHTPGYKEEEGLAMWRWSQEERRAEAERTIDPDIGCRGKSDLALLMDAMTAPEWDQWPLSRLTPGQAFAALHAGVERIATADARPVVQSMLGRVRLLIDDAHSAFATGDFATCRARLAQARHEELQPVRVDSP